MNRLFICGILFTSCVFMAVYAGGMGMGMSYMPMSYSYSGGMGMSGGYNGVWSFLVFSKFRFLFIF